jgi:hypothetical protein
VGDGLNLAKFLVGVGAHGRHVVENLVAAILHRSNSSHLGVVSRSLVVTGFLQGSIVLAQLFIHGFLLLPAKLRLPLALCGAEATCFEASLREAVLLVQSLGGCRPLQIVRPGHHCIFVRMTLL